MVFPNVKLLLNHNRITKITITNLCTDFIQVTQILPLISMCRFRVSCCLYVLFLFCLLQWITVYLYLPFMTLMLKTTGEILCRLLFGLLWAVVFWISERIDAFLFGILQDTCPLCFLLTTHRADISSNW